MIVVWFLLELILSFNAKCLAIATGVINQRCENAIQIFPNGQPIEGSTTQARFDNTNIDSCASTFDSPGLWYVVVGTGRTLQADTCSYMTDFDTKISVYRGICGNFECVESDDDGCGNLSSSIIWDAELFVNYYIRVHGFDNTATGNFGLTLSSFEPPTNTNCNNAITLSIGDQVEFSMTAVPSSHELIDCFDGFDNHALWYQFVGTGKPIKVSTCSSYAYFDGMIQIFTGNECSDLICTEQTYSRRLCSSYDSDCIYSSVLTQFLADEGIQYYFLLFYSEWEWDSPSNIIYNLTVTEVELALNDLCETATPILEVPTGLINGSTYDAFPDSVTCGSFNESLAPGVWFSVAGTGNVLMASASTTDYEFDPGLYVFTGNCDNLECISYGITDYRCGGMDFYPSHVATFKTQVGMQYFIFITDEYSSSAGDFVLSIDDAEVPPNEFCSDAIVLVPDSAPTIGSISNATSFLGVNYFCTYSVGTPSVWYSLAGTGNDYAVSTCSQELNFDSAISVSAGSCDNHECITYSITSDENCNNTAYNATTVTFSTEIGVDYLIVVIGLNGTTTGSFGLTVTTEKIPPQTDCLNAMQIRPNNGTIYGSFSSEARLGHLEYPCRNDSATPLIFYSLNGTGEEYAISTCSRELTFDSGITVSTGPCDDLHCIVYNSSAEINCTETSYRASRVVLKTEVGLEYFVAVHGLNNPTRGKFGLTVSDLFSTPKPNNTNGMAIDNGNATHGGSTGQSKGSGMERRMTKQSRIVTIILMSIPVWLISWIL